MLYICLWSDNISGGSPHWNNNIVVRTNSYFPALEGLNLPAFETSNHSKHSSGLYIIKITPCYKIILPVLCYSINRAVYIL